MAFAREIFIQIKNIIRFQQSEKESDSHYTILGNTLVRVSNHCTYMYVWENYFNIYPKQRGMKILSLVFEDNKDTFHTNCLVTQHNTSKPIVVEEYVYPLHGNAQYLSKVDVNAIINSLQNLQRTNRFNEPTGKAQRYVRKSINPTTQNITTDTNGISTFSSEFGYGTDNVSESKTNKNMKKNVIKLNENTLRRIVAESVRKVLKEHAWESASTFEELQKTLAKVTGILGTFSHNIPQEHGAEFMKLVGREWNDLWDSLTSIQETVMHIRNQRRLSDGDLTFDDLS